MRVERERMILRPYQVEDLDIVLAAEDGSALIANTMGTGKTLLAVEAVRAVAPATGRALVIAPLNTHTGWERTIRAQSGPDTPIHRLTGGKDGKLAWDALADGWAGWYLIGWEYFRRFDWRPPGVFDVAVADECHRAQNRKSKTAKALWSVRARRKLAMSGTPAGNRIEGLWSVLHWLWPEQHPHYWPWVKKYLRTRPNRYTQVEIVGEKVPGQVIRSVPCYTRRKLEDVVADLPERITYTVDTRMLPAQARIYRQFEAQSLAWLKEHPVATPLPVQQRLRMLQTALGVPTLFEKEELDEDGFPKTEIGFEPDCKSAKIDAMLDIVSDLPEHTPVMVYTHSARFAEVVVARLNDKGIGRAELWTGRVPQHTRMRVLKEFGGGVRFIVAGIAAIGEGVDGLQRVCNHEIWLSKHDNGLLNEQAAARLLRMGQSKPVLSWVIRAEDTIDTLVYQRLDENAEAMAFALEKED